MEGQGLYRAIEYAIRAGAFRVAARDFPAAADTFEAAAEINHARAEAALTSWTVRRCNASTDQ